MKTAHDIIIRPVITEAAMDLMAAKTYGTATREAVKAQSALVVLDSMDAAVIKSCANIPTAKTTQYNTLSVYDILNAEKLVMTVEAVKKLEEVYA